MFGHPANNLSQPGSMLPCVTCVNNQLRLDRSALESAPLMMSTRSLPPPYWGHVTTLTFVVLPGSIVEGHLQAMTHFSNSQLGKQSNMHFEGMLYTLA